MQAVVQITHINASHSTTNPPPTTLQCSKISGDWNILGVNISVPAADTNLYSEGQQFTITG